MYYIVAQSNTFYMQHATWCQSTYTLVSNSTQMMLTGIITTSSMLCIAGYIYYHKHHYLLYRQYQYQYYAMHSIVHHYTSHAMHSMMCGVVTHTLLLHTLTSYTITRCIQLSSSQYTSLHTITMTSSIHAMLMLFFFIMPGALSGLGNLLVPIQLCVPEMMFPKVNNLGSTQIDVLLLQAAKGINTPHCCTLHTMLDTPTSIVEHLVPMCILVQCPLTEEAITQSTLVSPHASLHTARCTVLHVSIEDVVVLRLVDSTTCNSSQTVYS